MGEDGGGGGVISPAGVRWVISGPGSQSSDGLHCVLTFYSVQCYRRVAAPVRCSEEPWCVLQLQPDYILQQSGLFALSTFVLKCLMQLPVVSYTLIYIYSYIYVCI